MSVMIDERSYPVVKIGNQLWMAENLDWKWDGLDVSSAVKSVPAASYYNRSEATYGVDGLKYGLLYNGYASNYLVSNQSCALPEGWHVPSETDFSTLKENAGGSVDSGANLKSTTGWYQYINPSFIPATDKFSFNAKPTGREVSTNSYSNVGKECGFWTASPGRYDYEGTYACLLYNNNTLSVGGNTMNRARGFSIRLCKNL